MDNPLLDVAFHRIKLGNNCFCLSAGSKKTINCFCLIEQSLLVCGNIKISVRRLDDCVLDVMKDAVDIHIGARVEARGIGAGVQRDVRFLQDSLRGCRIKNKNSPIRGSSSISLNDIAVLSVRPKSYSRWKRNIARVTFWETFFCWICYCTISEILDIKPQI